MARGEWQPISRNPQKEKHHKGQPSDIVSEDGSQSPEILRRRSPIVVNHWLNRWRGCGVAAVLMGALLLALLTAECPLTVRDEGNLPWRGV